VGRLCVHTACSILDIPCSILDIPCSMFHVCVLFSAFCAPDECPMLLLHLTRSDGTELCGAAPPPQPQLLANCSAATSLLSITHSKAPSLQLQCIYLCRVMRVYKVVQVVVVNRLCPFLLPPDPYNQPPIHARPQRWDCRCRDIQE
jgi:hypothetical protein